MKTPIVSFQSWRTRLTWGLALCLTLISTAEAATAEARGPVIFAAASLKTALDEIATLYEDATSQSLRISYAGSSALARQIEQGAPADLFISANQAWMDHLEAKGLLVEDLRTDLLGNRLVVIGPVQEAAAPTSDFETLLSEGKIAMALVEAVPAGIYGKEALTTLGLWDRVAPRVVQADNVRAALALVALQAVPLGITYESDAVAEPRVSILARFSEDTHAPIIYPAAPVAAGQIDLATPFLDYLSGPEATAVFEANGFTVMGVGDTE